MEYAAVDLALQAAVPVVSVPLHGKFVPLATAGHRFLIASDGMHMELRRDWVHAIWPVAIDTRVAKPFGTVKSKVELVFDSVPKWVCQQFAKEAAASGDIEIAASVIWNSATQSLHYRRCEAIHASSSRIDYLRPVLGAGESLVVDLHSHGFGPAFFSSRDDADDRGDVKLAVVVGSVNDTPTWRFRLCLAGVFVPLASPKWTLDSEWLTNGEDDV